MIDAHCHLDACEPPAEELVGRALSAGVRRIATVGTDPASVERALDTARAHHEVGAVVGRHPHHAEGFGEAELEELARAAAFPEVVAIGETGLDYHRDLSPRPDQLSAFERQLVLAGRLGLPAVIHTRAAEEDTFAVLREHAHAITVVLHCFSTPARLDECVERGYVCSFAGNVTYPDAVELRAAARDVPQDLLLLETDAPYLAPREFRGKPNEPGNVVYTAELVAELRGIGYKQLDALVEENAERVFGW